MCFRFIFPVLWVLGFSACHRAKTTPAAYPDPPAAAAGAALSVRLASCNVRYEDPGEKRAERLWPNRIYPMVRALRAIRPDVFGVQEALHGQCADLRASLTDYDFHGVGRDDGKRMGEYAGIFFKRARFAMDESDRGTFWLSATPELAGSMTWGNTLPRVAGWVRLIDRDNGRGFYVFNTHWDHRNQPSREAAARLIAGRIDRRRHANEPVVLLGDFNVRQDNPAVAYLLGVKSQLGGTQAFWPRGMTDVFQQLHPNEPARTTLHLWENSRAGSRKVDYIFVSKPCHVKAADIASGERVPISDHFPVWAEVEF